MSRYAPTIVVGLGGSGASTLRDLKRRILADDPKAPVILLAIDLDPTELINPAYTEDLTVAEQQFFKPNPIENYLTNLNRHRGDESMDFDYLRRWLTIKDSRQVRNAQATTGAKQFRPLGRLGFFHYAKKIQEAVQKARAVLDEYRNESVLSGVPPMAYLVTSLAGGTGSGMMFDAAAMMRTEMPDIPVTAFCLLPDVFAMHRNIDNIFANAYANLQELAHLKNQHILFDAQYKGVLSISKSQSIILFDRVFLFGGWLGETRPFNDSKQIYPYLADVLRLLMITEMRKVATRYQANAGGDSRRVLSDPFSKHVFGEVAAVGIRLMSWGELGLQVLQELVAGLPESGVGLAALLRKGADASPVDVVRKLIDEAEENLTAAELRSTAARKLDSVNVMTGRAEDITRFIYTARKLVAGAASESPSMHSTNTILLPHIVLDDEESIVEEPIRRVLTSIAGTLSEVAGRSYLPGELELRLRQIADAIPFPDTPPLYPHDLRLNRVANCVREDTPFKGVFALSSLKRTVGYTRRVILDNIEKDLPFYKTVFRHRVGTALRRLLDDYRTHDASRWTKLDEFQGDFAKMFPRRPARDNAKQDEVDQNKSIYLDCSNVVPPLQLFTKHVKTPSARAIADRLAQKVATAHASYRNESNVDARRRILDELAGYAQTLFGQDLAAEVAGGNTFSRFLDPGDFFSDDKIRKLIERCSTPLFKEGSVPPTIASVDARMLVAGIFPNRNEFVQKLENLCNGVLHTRVESVFSEDNRDDGRIAIIVEKLFRAASDLEGIYRYYDFYRQSAAPELHHVDARWLPELKPLVSEGGAMGRVSCGNVGCDSDIRDLDRDEIFCPECGEPIRNRCGNRGCPIDDLGDRTGLASIIERRFCPGCDKLLRTYWWHCERHGVVPIDKITCPICVRDRLSLDDTSHRPDFRTRFYCPSCKKKGHSPPFTVAGIVTRWLINGVNGHEVIPARERFNEILTSSSFCPTCGVVLVPYCPYEHPYRPSFPHFLFRDPAAGARAPFRCYLHVDQVFYTCNVCEYPVPESSSRCDRCGTSLRKCRFCTDIFHRLVPAGEEGASPTRCAHCGTWPHEPEATESHAESQRDRFCSNIYGCPAGARLREATFVPETTKCPVCEAIEPRLLDVESRPDHLAACALCSEVFGSSPRDQISRRVSEDAGTCCLCGRRFADTDRLHTETTDWKSTLVIARALVREQDDRAAFSCIYQEMPKRDEIPRRLLEFVQAIVHPKNRAMAEPRVEWMLAHWDRQFGCRNGSQKTPCDGGSPANAPEPNGPKGTIHSTETVRDPDFILGYENDVSGWVRLLRQHGYEREHLRNLRASILDLTRNEHQRHRVAAIVDHAIEIWDSVDE